MEQEKFEWLPESPQRIGLCISPENICICTSWDEAIAYIAEFQGYDEVEEYVRQIITDISEQVQMSSSRVWSQWFKKEPRKLISWLNYHGFIRVLCLL